MAAYEKVGGEIGVNSAQNGFQTRSDLARLTDGRFVAIWDSTDGQDTSSTGIKGRLMGANGAPLGSEFLINTATVGAQDNASVAGLADGGFVVTWATADAAQDGSSQAVKAQLFDAAGARRGGEFLVNSTTANTQWNPSVAALDNGGFVIAWDTYTHAQDSSRGIAAQVYDAAGVRVGGEFLVNTATADVQAGSEISTLSGGRFVVTWATQSGGQLDVRAQVFAASGARIGGEIVVNTQTAQSQTEIVVSDLANGGFVVAWTSFDTTQDGAGYAIKAQVFDAAAAKVGSELLVNTAATANQRLPAVEGLANGDFVIAWRTDDGTADQLYGGIKAQVFDGAGAKIGGEFLVNTAGSVAETEPAVVDLGNGAFAVSWTGGSSQGDIRSQVFSSGSAPVITSNGGGAAGAVTVAEDSLAVATVAAYDIDGPAIAYAIAGGADAARFAIDAASGALSFVAAPDFEAPADADADNVYQVVVRASDGARSDEQTLLVSVIAQADVTAITSDGGGSSAAVAVLENGLAVTTVAAAGSGSMAFSIVGGADAARFQIDSATGALSFRTAPDRETPTDAGGNNVYDVTVGATNGLWLDTQAIAITVGNVNEWAPVISGNYPGYTVIKILSENSLLNLVFWAPDADGDAVTYSITGPDADKFVMNPTTGFLRFVNPADFEAPGSAQGSNLHQFDVIASDGTFSDLMHVGVSLQNVNEALAITSDGGGAAAALAVGENGTVVTTVVAADPEQVAPAYAITGGADAARFAINAATGVLSFVAAPDFEAPGDADGDNVYQVTVRASDGTYTDSQALSVTVTDGNDAPTITSDGGGASAAFALAEGQTAVTTVVATDPDLGQTLTYAIAAGGDSARFAIDATTGALSFVAVPDFEAPADTDGDNHYQVIVLASDGTDTDAQSLLVTVGNVNEAPQIVSDGGGPSAALALAEGQTAVTTVVANDPDAGPPLTYTIAGGADAALFLIDAETGALSFAAAPDYEAPADEGADNLYDVIVSASDGQFSASQAIAVLVGDLTELSFEQTAFAEWENYSEGAALDIVGGNPLDPVSYTITGGADAALFALSLEGFLLLGVQDFEAPADADGDNLYEVAVTAQQGAYFVTATLSVAVNDVNEAPSFVSAPEWVLAENEEFIGVLEALDPEGQGMTYFVAGGADGHLFQVVAATGEFGLVLAPDFELPADADGDNVYEVEIGVADNDHVVTTTIRVTVGDVAEGLTFTETAFLGWENDPEAATLSVTNGSVTASYAITGGADGALFALDAASGELTFVAAPDFEARGDADSDNVYEVEVTATDGPGVATETILVTLADIDEAPTITSPGAFTRLENGTTVGTVAATDPEGASLTYRIVGGADASRVGITASMGALFFYQAPNFEAPTDFNLNNVYDVVVEAFDGTLAVTQAIAITVGNVNEAPVITSGGGGTTAGYSVSENTTAVVSIVANDPEGAVTYAIVGGSDAAKFAIDQGTGALRFVTAPDYEAPTDTGSNNSYEVVVRASDGSLTDTQAVTVAVSNVAGVTRNGSSASETLTGTGEEDTILGNAGSDTLVGLGGADVLTGGTQADRFQYNAIGDSTPNASDRILDFSRSQGDRIDLSALDANVVATGNQSFSFIGSSAFSSAGQLRYFQQGSDTIVQGDVNGDRVADFQIVLDTLVSLTSSDFLL